MLDEVQELFVCFIILAGAVLNQGRQATKALRVLPARIVHDSLIVELAANAAQPCVVDDRVQSTGPGCFVRVVVCSCEQSLRHVTITFGARFIFIAGAGLVYLKGRGAGFVGAGWIMTSVRLEQAGSMRASGTVRPGLPQAVWAA